MSGKSAAAAAEAAAESARLERAGLLKQTAELQAAVAKNGALQRELDASLRAAQQQLDAVGAEVAAAEARRRDLGAQASLRPCMHVAVGCSRLQ